MTPHCKIYFDHFDYKTQSEVMCEACGAPAVDIHHIFGRGEGRDEIKNLMALCRRHHDMAHTSITKSEMYYIHQCYMAGQRALFLK